MDAWQEIFNHLDSKGIDVYAPGQKKGTCTENYVVIKQNVQSPMLGTNKVGYSIIDILLFLPLNRYSQIDNYKRVIKSYLKELEWLMPTGQESPTFIDEEVKAHTLSIEYQIMKKL